MNYNAFALVCGETGIRTLGSPYEDQRFSRPPHSTALASLRNESGVQKYEQYE